MRNRINKEKGITLVALIITIVILIILATVTIITMTDNKLLDQTAISAQEYNKQLATETMNLKIKGIEMQSYTEKMKLPNLQYLVDRLCEDDDIEYVRAGKEIASLDKIDVTNNTSIYTKLKAYPYKFEIDSSLQLVRIEGEEIVTRTKEIAINKNGTITEDVEGYDHIRINTNVPNIIPDNYMERPTMENVKITEAKKDIDVTNYKSIDTSSLYENQGTSDMGTTTMTNGTASFSVNFVPQKTIIEILATGGYQQILIITGVTNGTVYDGGKNESGTKWYNDRTLDSFNPNLYFENGRWIFNNWGTLNGTVNWYVIK